jgi:hypothetical protein
MALYQWSTGDRISASRLNTTYNLLKGISGGEDTIRLSNNEADTLQLRPSSNPSSDVPLFTVDLADGTAKLGIWSHGGLSVGNQTDPGATNLTVLGTSVFTGEVTFSGDIAVGDDDDIVFGAGSDVQMRWSTGDSSNHAMVMALGNSNQALHITDVGAQATDWNLSAVTDPNIYIHSNTTPATDYLRLGGHDGTTAYIDLVGGTNLDFQIAGTSEMELTATILAPSTSDGLALGSTSLMWGDLFLASAGVINFNNGDVTLTHSSNAVTVAGGTWATAALTASTITGSGVLSIDDTTASSSTTTGSIHTDGGLGVAGDIYGGDDLALTSSGAVVNFNAGDMLITHSSNTLTVSGGTLATAALTASTITGSGVLSIDDTTESTSTTSGSVHTDGGLGVAGDIYAGDDVFLSSGAVLNFNSGDVTVTHSSNALTVAGGTWATAALSASTITGSGVLSVDDTTESTSTTSGSIHTDGGLGVAGDVYAGDDVFLTSGAVLNFDSGDVTVTHGSNVLTLDGGVLSVDTTTESTSTTTGSIHTDGGLGVAGDIYAGDDVFLSSGAVLNFNAGDVTLTHSSNALTVAGGTLATAALTASTITGSGVLSVDDTTESTSTTSGSIHTDGGLGVAGDIYAGDDVFFASGAVLNFNSSDVTLTHGSNVLTLDGGILSVDTTTESTSTTTGSIHTDGGLGVAGDIYAGDDIFLASGAVLNFNSGDVTVTHSANTLTITGGIMALDTASTIGNLTLGNGSITDSGGSISFGNENVSTTGTLSAAATTVTGTLDAESYMSIGNGSAVDADQTLTIARDFTVASGTGNHLRIDGQITAAANANVFHVNVDSSTVTSGTNDYIATLNIDEPNISGGGAVTHAATVRISGVPTEGTSINAALWVDAGMLLADGGINIVSASDNNKIHTSSTGGGASTLYIGNTSITTSSDSRIKHNIEAANISALDTIRPLELKKFNWDDPTDTASVNQNARGDYYGFMAQDTIKEVPWIINAEDRDCPECLAGVLCRQHETFWKVEYQHMVPLLTAAIQELEAKVRQLEGDA